MSQELRQAINKLDITGVVKESKLNAGEIEKGEKKGDKYINGSLVIKAGEFKEVEVKVYVNEKTQEGKVRKVYSTLKQIIDKEHRTLADGASEEEAVKIRLWGNEGFSPQFREEMYVTEKNPDEVTTRISLDLGFGNVTIDDRITPEDYKATFDVEMFVVKVLEEVKQQEETGRVIVKGYVPVYGGEVIPLEVVAGKVEDEEGEYDFAEDIRQSINEGDTVNLWGDIDYRAIITKKEKGGSLGRAKVEESRTYVNDLVAIGGDIIDNVDKEFDEELIRVAVKERENKKDEVLQETKQNKKSKGKGKGISSGTKSSDKKGEIPF